MSLPHPTDCHRISGAGTGSHATMKRIYMSPATDFCSLSPPIEDDSPKPAKPLPEIAPALETEMIWATENATKVPRRMTLLSDNMHRSPTSVTVLNPALAEKAMPGSTRLSKMCQFIEQVYSLCVDAGMFCREGGPSEDGWGVVIATQSLLYEMLPEVTSPQHAVHSPDFDDIVELPVEVRRMMAAALVSAMTFQKSRGIPQKIYCSELDYELPGSTAIYFLFFLTFHERVEVAQTASSGPLLRRARFVIEKMAYALSYAQMDLLKRVTCPYRHMARSVLQLAEEQLWQRLEACTETAIQVVEEFYTVRSIAVFLIRAAARQAPELVFKPENQDNADGVALAAVCGHLRGPCDERLPTETVRYTAVEFVKAAMRTPLSSNLYVDRYAPPEPLYPLVSPAALHDMLRVLRKKTK